MIPLVRNIQTRSIHSTEHRWTVAKGCGEGKAGGGGPAQWVGGSSGDGDTRELDRVGEGGALHSPGSVLTATQHTL